MIVVYLLLVATICAFIALIYRLHQMYRQATADAASDDGKIDHDVNLLLEKNINLMDATQLSELQAQVVDLIQIHVFAPDPMDLHSDKVYASTLDWCRNHIADLDNPVDKLGHPCMVFWCRASETKPKAVDLVRRLYFDLGYEKNVFKLVLCARLPDYMFYHDMLVHRFRNGSVRAYSNSRYRGVTDFLFELHADEAVSRANLMRCWLNGAKKSEIVVKDLDASNMNPAVNESDTRKTVYTMQCFDVTQESLGGDTATEIIKGMFSRETARVITSDLPRAVAS